MLVAAALVLPSPAAAVTTSITDPSGEHVLTCSSPGDCRVSNEAQDWMRNYGQPAADEWHTGTGANGGPRPPAVETVVAEDEAALARGMAGRILPAIGRVLPWVGAGFAAYEVCNAISAGCFIFDRSDIAAPPTTFTIDFFDVSQTLGRFATDGTYTGSCPFATCQLEGGAAFRGHEIAQTRGYFAWDQSGPSYNQCSGPDSSDVPGMTVHNFSEGDPCYTTPNDPTSVVGMLEGPAIRDITAETGVLWHAGNDPGIPDSSEEWGATGTTSGTGFMEYLNGLPAGQGQRLVNEMAHQLDPTNVSDPYPNQAGIPDCTGMAYSQCIDALQAAGFGVTHRTYAPRPETTPLPQGQAGHVIRTVPAAGTATLTDQDVDVRTNPQDESDMDYLVPNLHGVPAEGVNYDPDEWEAAVGPFGLDPADLSDHISHLSDSTLDPTVGPHQVASTFPASGTRVHYGTWPDVRVNPESAPNPDPSGDPSTSGEPTVGSDGWAAPSIRAIDTGPLQGAFTGCKFPFCIFSFLSASFGGWAGGASCPTPDLDLNSGGTTNGDEKLTVHADLCKFEPAMAIVRPVILICSFLGLAWLFATVALGLGGGGKDD